MSASPSISELRAELIAWLHDNAAELARPYEGSGSLPEQMTQLSRVKRLLWDAGFTGWGWPERAGGRGGSPMLRAVVGEEIVERVVDAVSEPGMIYHLIGDDNSEIWVDAENERFRRREAAADGGLTSVGEGWIRYTFDAIENQVVVVDANPEGPIRPRIDHPMMLWVEALGALAVGIFAAESWGGASGLLESGKMDQLWIQVIGVGASALYCFVGTIIIAFVVDKVCGGFRIVEGDEAIGLDSTQHGEAGYHIGEPGLVS